MIFLSNLATVILGVFLEAKSEFALQKKVLGEDGSSLSRLKVPKQTKLREKLFLKKRVLETRKCFWSEPMSPTFSLIDCVRDLS